MKTAYELAMERLGGEKTSLTDAQKSELAEIDRTFDAKVAETKLAYEGRISEAQGEPDKADELREELAAELRKLADRRESRKNAVRGGRS